MDSPRAVRFSRSASRDLRSARSWYAKQVEGLERRFDVAVTETVASIAAHPTTFAIVYRDVRRAVVRVFPYGVYFRTKEGDVHVIAVIHLHRDASVWQKRADFE